MARHVTIRRTKTTTEDLHPAWVYVLGGMGLLAALEVGALLVVWLLVSFNL